VTLYPFTIIRQAYIRIGAWAGNSAELNALYNADTTFEQVDTESFPPQSMYDMLTAVENEIGTSVAMNNDSVLRRVLHDTATVISGGLIPSTGDAGGAIIGNWGQVIGSDGIELTPGLHQDEVAAVVNGPTGLFKSTLHSFTLRPPRIFATVSSLTIDVCTFDYAARATVIAAGGNLLFPQCPNAYFAGLMSYLKNQDSSYTELSNQFAPAYQAWLASPTSSRDVVVEAQS
jgi:hypothetical protein